ncbi:peptidase [Amycolatopsis antarctica]|uniref:Peptidase n=1 Tax=Amycolatopsis antarctica TaxID=1854586 RepID=A0A263CWZ1_9PSEU|nr:LON peptidase substrate-binding domain-containing protein [Amycolatopsis antarctica]OZM70499.1 peptidase [Amycolatopsis antarctica]
MADEPGESGEQTGATLPIFPLQTVLLPGAHLPLHIFEPRYRQLTVDLVTEVVPEREFGIVAIKTSLVREVENLGHLYGIGCSAVLREAERLDDGRFDIVVTGSRRFRLLDLDCTSAPYLTGNVEWLADDPIPAEAGEITDRLADVARAAHQRYCDSAWKDEEWTVPRADVRPAELAYELAADCLLTLHDRQRLLEETQPLRRLRIACRVLAREAGFLSALRAVPAPLSQLSGPSKPCNLN